MNIFPLHNWLDKSAMLVLVLTDWNSLFIFLGAVYLEGGLDEARQLFGRLLFNTEVSG